MTIQESIGTNEYMAPEVLSSPQSYNPFLADVYSMGCVLFEIVFGVGRRFQNLKGSEKDYVQANPILQLIQECQKNIPGRPTSSEFKKRFEGKENIFLI